ncbi:hypothetical protein PRIPAC_72319 [Pristionchus pacificus]|uniref:Major sperm protein n=1 Tax=Pristionchus pacificus TaxID=54126 RepID=A0A2A6CZJ4_PRIPA|nr:hypothetical protein PRIPAC_72319 [Pristionchus pacificus]|eukprot:PDM83548.1 MSP domain-containing protein [Pristionchus pacificus]
MKIQIFLLLSFLSPPFILHFCSRSKWSTPEMSLDITPNTMSFPAAGGTITAKMTNPSESRLAIKVKTSNNECYRVKPVYGFIESKGEAPLEVMRLNGPPKDDKIVVQWAEVPLEETDPKAPFAAQAQQGEVILPLKAE